MAGKQIGRAKSQHGKSAKSSCSSNFGWWYWKSDGEEPELFSTFGARMSMASLMLRASQKNPAGTLKYSSSFHKSSGSFSVCFTETVCLSVWFLYRWTLGLDFALYMAISSHLKVDQKRDIIKEKRSLQQYNTTGNKN